MRAHPIHSGTVFSAWTVLSESTPDGGVRRFACRCECGTIRKVRIDYLRYGRSKSCGCRLWKDQPTTYRERTDQARRLAARLLNGAMHGMVGQS